MHIRFSGCIGMPVMEQHGGEVIALVSGILIHPDTATVEGLFVKVPRFLHTHELFIAAPDIRHWGKRITVRDEEVLAEVGDHIRLRTIFEDPRTVLGQRIVTDGGRVIGTCKDIQINTKFMQMEWLFPKRFFSWKRAIPTSSIVQIRPDAIIVREELQTAPAIKPAILDPLVQPTPS